MSRVLLPTGASMVNYVNQILTINLKKGRPAYVAMPSLRSLANKIVNETAPLEVSETEVTSAVGE